MHKVVIVGAGLAGHRAACELRKQGYDDEITMVGDEPHPPYDRPPLSKQVLEGTMEHRDLFFPSEDLHVTWKLGEPATGLDPLRKMVRVGAGAELPYDGLIIATGRGAREWPGDLGGLDGFYTLRSFDHCRRLKDNLLDQPRVAIVGAGFIGCEVAATLRGRGVEQVTVIDVAGYPMAGLGPEVGRHAAGIHTEEGVRFRLGTTVTGFEGNGRVERVLLCEGPPVDTDLVLFALGSAPSSDWLADSGLRLQDGNVVCDENLFAIGYENITVAGDIASFPHPHIDGLTRVEHWSAAREMGTLAAANLIGEPGQRTPFRAVPTFWSNQYNLKIKSAGFINQADSFTVIEEDSARRSLVVEARRGGRLVGAVTVNKNKKIIEYTRELAAAG